MSVEYRAAHDLEIRAEGDGRTIRGIAVPYNRAQKINNELTEMFSPGAFRNQLDKPGKVRLTRDHQAHGGDIIGRAHVLRDDAAGLYGEWRVSDTAVGNDTLALIRDGALDELSIGFRAGRHLRMADGTVNRTSAHLFEVAIVAAGAYGQAATVSGVRADEDGESIEDVVEEAVSDERRERLVRARQILAGLPLLPV